MTAKKTNAFMRLRRKDIITFWDEKEDLELQELQIKDGKIIGFFISLSGVRSVREITLAI